MDSRQAREVGQALAFQFGDLRDWPLQCGWCGSEQLEDDPARNVLRCRGCGKWTTHYVAHEQREQRARREVESGVGAGMVRVLMAAGAPKGPPSCALCNEPATQVHGIPPDLTYTCDIHAEEVILRLLGELGSGEESQ